MSNIVEVQFQGDRIQATREGEQVWVVVKRVCEALGIEHSAQVTKLKTRLWATMSTIDTVGADGRSRAILCLDLDSLPMWLATIEVSRVRPEARDKLIAYQRECARVLRDHFFGRHVDNPSSLAPILGQIATALTQLVQRQDNFDARLVALEGRSGAAIQRYEAASIKRRITAAARRSVRLGQHGGKWRRAQLVLQSRVQRAANWTGAGSSWDRLPAAYYPFADRELVVIEREIEALEEARGNGNPSRQLSLIRAK